MQGLEKMSKIKVKKKTLAQCFGIHTMLPHYLDTAFKRPLLGAHALWPWCQGHEQ